MSIYRGIMNILSGAYPNPVAGENLASWLGVNREAVARAVAVLRSEGKDIVVTPKGYVLNKRDAATEMVAVSHTVDKIEEEISLILQANCTVVDVVVEHPLYGEIRGMLNIRNHDDLKKFLAKMKTTSATPLLVLSKGVHLHTLAGGDRADILKAKQILLEKGFLIA